ncbi:tetratricopeptide repeat protein [Horticoccus sp. 23ND18S-11]|uniref:tetratricopeptide repeat protein n=1 Tax=Horticoccus sp. 23ND18S-11 TaxID=3391832 RepID=UPI0039C9783C
MNVRFLRWLVTGSTPLWVLPATQAVDPYQSRLDREYKSYSNALSRAYSPPPPRPSPTPSYSSRSYSSPSYSSSSTSRNYSAPSSSRSTSSYTSRSTPPSNVNSYRETQRNLSTAKKTYESRFVSPSPARPVQTAANRAAETAARAASEKAAREAFLRAPSHPAAAWARILADTKGKAPLAAPPNSALESRRGEFAHYLGVVQQLGAKAPWEAMRLGQLCLLFQGQGAEPARAFEFFSQSNPAWPEVQLGLGLCHLRGYGVTPNPEKAREWLEQAASPAHATGSGTQYAGSGEALGDSGYQACRELAVAYDLGVGLPADPALASQWYSRAQFRPLHPRDYDEIHALKGEFWARHARSARKLLEQEFAAARMTAGSVPADLQDLSAIKDAQVLYEIGEFADTRSTPGGTTGVRRSGSTYFLAAAKLDHDAAARAYFSPAKNGTYNRDLDGDAFWKEHDEYVKAQWPKWEQAWLAAAKGGDAAANIPLAFYYSGARGNPPKTDLAQRHAAQMPATMPEAQRNAVQMSISLADARQNQEWVRTVWLKFGATPPALDLARLGVPADAARGAALRDEGNALAGSDLKQARDRWRDAAALGDLPAQVLLFIYAKQHNAYLADPYEKSLQARLEASAAQGDLGAIATLAALLDGSYHNRLHLGTATSQLGGRWLGEATKRAPHRSQFLQIGRDPSLTDAHCARVRAAALQESDAWQAVARTWGLTGTHVMAQLTLTPAEIRGVDGKRTQYLALAAAARRLEAQLAVWEKAIARDEFDPEADVRYVQAYEAWLGRDETERDVARAVDYFAQSVGLGQPVAPLALAYFFGSGYGGFPQDAAISRRFRALADARLTALAEDDNHWAQTILGDLLVTDGATREDRLENPGAFEWLPPDKPRGLKWLAAAAIEGATLPRNFGDSQGQMVAYYLSQRYYDEKDGTSYCRWKLIDEAYRDIRDDEPGAEAQWTKARAFATSILGESEEATKARLALETVLNETEDETKRAALLVQRALGRKAEHLDRLASQDAELAVSADCLNVAAWKLLARLQREVGETAEADVSVHVTRILENDASAASELEAALRRLTPDRQEVLRFRFAVTLEGNPTSAPLKLLTAIATKVQEK